MQTAAAPPPCSFASKVRREEDRVWIDGVRHLGWKYASTVHGAYATIMETVGAPISYDELVGVGALAFRMQIHETGTCPSSPHSHCGYDCIERSWAANPWETQRHILEWLKPDDPADMSKLREVRQLVMASIDRGIPVQYGTIEDGVIVGYQAGGEEWICLHPMHDNAEKPYLEKSPTWYVVIYTGPKTTAPDQRKLARESLEQAVAMWSAGRAPGGGSKYYVGEAAWHQWIDCIGKLSDEDAEKDKTGRHGNAWIYQATTSYRRSAAIYLRKIAPMFGDAAAEHLYRAANLYARMADEVLSDSEHDVKTIAPYPSDAPWTPAQRNEQLRRMRIAMELDREAIQALQRALAGDRMETLRFTGDIYSRDSFSMAMEAVARFHGRTVSYDELYILSGNAFAPALRPAEPERSHWAIQGGGRNIDLVCRQLGLTFRALPRPDRLGHDIPPRPDEQEAIRRWEWVYFHMPSIRAVQSSLASGELVLSMGEFAGGEVSWTEWGIVTAANDDGTISGAASNGRLDNAIAFVRDGWFIAPAASTARLDDAELRRETIRRAILRIHGDVVVKTEMYDRGIVFGLPAMDAWITAMQAPGFCPHCPNDPGCARRIAQPVYYGAVAAAAWLRRCAEVARDSPEPLARAAGHYEHIAALLAPYVELTGYGAIIGDLSFQRQHAQEVLIPVRNEFAAAAMQMQAAIDDHRGAALQAASVRC